MAPGTLTHPEALELLDAAAHRPRTVLCGRAAHADLATRPAVPLESIVRNPALVDGNKRLGWLATVVFLGLNDVTLEAPDDGGHELVMSVARSGAQVEQISAALRSWH
jgi:death-on-curing protein